MQHVEQAATILTMFHQYAKHAELTSYGTTVLTLQLYGDGSGAVVDLADGRTFLIFDDLKHLHNQLQEEQRKQWK